MSLEVIWFSGAYCAVSTGTLLCQCLSRARGLSVLMLCGARLFYDSLFTAAHLPQYYSYDLQQDRPFFFYFLIFPPHSFSYAEFSYLFM